MKARKKVTTVGSKSRLRGLIYDLIGGVFFRSQNPKPLSLHPGSICIYIYICTYIYICVYMYACMYLYIYMYV